MLTDAATRRRRIRPLPTTSAEAPLVYLAGPYSKPDPVLNTHQMLKIADAILEAGFVPLVPHLSLAWHLVSPKPYREWLEYDRQLMLRCDLVLRVPGESHGAAQELELAWSKGIPVIYTCSTVPTECVSALRRALEMMTEDCADCGRSVVDCRCQSGEG